MPRAPDIWRLISTPQVAADAAPDALRDAAARLADVVAAPLAAYVLAPAEQVAGTWLVEPNRAKEGRLAAKLALARQHACLAEIAAAGIDVVAIKGFAAAHTLYADDPTARLVGDMDVLVRPRDRDRLIETLAAQGYAFRVSDLPPWGFMPRHSYAPFISRVGVVNLDIHIAPDEDPLARGLPAEAVFAAAQRLEAAIKVPAPSHALMIAVSNAAKDKFGPLSARKLVDATLLVRAPELDWDQVREIATAARMGKPLAVLMHLLVAPGTPTDRVPADVWPPLSGPARALFPVLRREVQALWPRSPTLSGGLWREAVFAAAPRAVVATNMRRGLGLLRPRDGIPLPGR